MKIGIDARELCNKPAGKGQYLWRIVASMLETSTISLVLYTQKDQVIPASLLGKKSIQREVVGNGVGWHRRVAAQLHKDGVDCFYAALSYQSALWNTVPTITVVHDLAVFRLPQLHHNLRSKLVERLTLKATLRKSAKIIAVSEATKNDLIELMGVQADRVTVAHGAPLLLDGSVVPLNFKDRDPFILFVGTLEPRKNIAGVLKTYSILPADIRATYPLKVVGKPGWGGEDYLGLSEKLGIREQVEFLGYRSNEELVDLYKKASIFFYPSLYEGFGLPVVEAMAVGTPVVTSNISALPEVVGKDGLQYQPDDFKGMQQGLIKLLTQINFYTEYSNYLYERSRQFSWSKWAQKTLEIVDAVCKK